MHTVSPTITSSGTFQANFDYLIVHEDRQGRLSFRVVQYNGPTTNMYDWGVHGLRGFKEEKIMISRRIRSADVPKAVAKFYNGNKVRYYK